MRTSESWCRAMEAARKRLRFNQTELATAVSRRTGRTLSQSEVSQIESGRRNSHWAIEAISKELEIELPDIIDDVAAPGPEEHPRGTASTTMVGTVLTNEELVLLEDWALEHGYTFADGRPNRSAAVRALVRQLGVSTNATSETIVDDGEQLLLDDDIDFGEFIPEDDARASGVGIHLLCRDDLGVTELEDGTFETRAWRVDEKWLHSAAYVALHQRKSEPSYRQGRLIEFRVDAERSDRYLLVVEPEGASVQWPGSQRGQNSIGIRRF